MENMLNVVMWYFLAAVVVLTVDALASGGWSRVSPTRCRTWTGCRSLGGGNESSPDLAR